MAHRYKLEIDFDTTDEVTRLDDAGLLSLYATLREVLDVKTLYVHRQVLVED
jgi:hypothetical protein